jgi:deoxyribonuclease-4
MLIGCHVSAAGSVIKAPQRAQEVGAEVFQFFSRSPQGGSATKITPAMAAEFKANCKKYKQAHCYIHTPYYINLASANNRIYYGSISVIREELERGSLLGVQYVMTHLGTSRGTTKPQATALVIAGLRKILDGYVGSTKLLLEISAGSGEIIGSSFVEIAAILKGIGKKDVGVCFDTAHAFASGYDLRTPTTVDRTVREFNKIIGLSRLKLIHCNDSKVDLNSRKDRHEHIGLGKIGVAGFRALLAHPKLQKVDFCLEMPEDERREDKENLAVMKKLRKH